MKFEILADSIKKINDKAGNAAKSAVKQLMTLRNWAIGWGIFFAEIGRPIYHIVKLKIEGNCFVGDATKCFKGQTKKEENLRLAEIYWESKVDDSNLQAVCEILVDGHITVIEIVKEINANISSVP